MTLQRPDANLIVASWSGKLDVRELKNLGLYYSLEVGYRLAPRGAAYLRWLS